MDFFLPHLSTIIAGLLAIFIISYFIQKRFGASKKQKAPEAAGGWPLIGHLRLFTGSQLPHISLGDLAEKYGPAFTIRIGVHPALVISSWEMAKECFTTNDVAACSRPKFIAAKHFSYDYAMFGFSPYGPFWREIRKIIALELLSNHQLELLKDIRVSETETSLKELYKLWTKKNDGSSRVLVEMKQWFGDLTLNVILRMVAGKRFFGAIAASDEKEARRCQKAFREFFQMMGLSLVGDAIPWLGWLDLGGHQKAMKTTAKEMDCLVSEWLEEHKQKRDSGEGKRQQDFMAVMLSILDGVDLAGYDADSVNKATCLNMIAGGNDTTMVTLTWTLSLLLNNPHTLKKAQEELDINVGKGRLVNEADINNLFYLQAVIKEALRLYPPGPLSGPREFHEDCTIGDYHVPKGTRLIVNLWKIQTDPRVWSDPLDFKPERFLTTHKDVDVKGQNFELIPFASGRRACPGISFRPSNVALNVG
uniref:Cytochrome P450 n=1 Tax=Fagus sylvatica TaxID=28930 RepID=A0A2N9IFN5_FAGSY